MPNLMEHKRKDEQPASEKTKKRRDNSAQPIHIAKLIELIVALIMKLANGTMECDVDVGLWIYTELNSFVERVTGNPIQLENVNPHAATLTWREIFYDLRGITNHHFDHLIGPDDWFQRYLELKKIRDAAFKKMKMVERSNADTVMQSPPKVEEHEAVGGAPGGVHGSAPGEVQDPEAQDP